MKHYFLYGKSILIGLIHLQRFLKQDERIQYDTIDLEMVSLIGFYDQITFEKMQKLHYRNGKITLTKLLMHFINIQTPADYEFLWQPKKEEVKETTREHLIHLIKTGNMCDVRIRKDSVEYNFQADFLKELF